MSLRINHNMSAANAHRSVSNNSAAQQKTMEKLSSGLKINRAADSPAQLQISENLRAQAAGLNQAIDNSEMAVSLLQTAEGALEEVSRALVQARQLAVHAGNEGVNDPNMLLADQREFANILEQINRVASSTQYGHNYLLDGSRSGNGVTTGANLEFIDAGSEAHSSGAGGYSVTIKQAATRSNHTGTVALTQKVIDSGEQITIKDLNLDNQLLEKINKFAPIKHILKNQADDDQKIIELLDDISRDLMNYDLEFRIQELESKFSVDMSEATFNELKELKKKQNLN